MNYFHQIGSLRVKSQTLNLHRDKTLGYHTLTKQLARFEKESVEIGRERQMQIDKRSETLSRQRQNICTQ